MTKIKNTKKGMAKKTLSMSLVVAMLATSNVPVWAAEFSDGTDAAFTSEAEAPVVEDNTTDATDAQATGDAWTVKLDKMPTEVEWGKTATVKAEVKDVNGTSVFDEKYDGETLNYVWKDASTGLAVTDAAPVSAEITTPTTTSTNVGTQYVLYIYDEKGDWTYTSSAFTVGAQDITGKYTLTVNDRVYTGKETAKDATINSGDIKFEIDYTGDLVNVGTVNVTAKPVDSKLYKGVISSSFKIKAATLIQNTDLVKAALNTKEVEYTGKEITLKKSDVNVTDANTGADLNDLVAKDADISTGLINVDTDATKNSATVTVPLTSAESVKNFSGTGSVTTTDQVKIVARDLSKVTVTIEPKEKPADGKAYTKDQLKITYKDANGKELSLKDTDVTVEGLDKAVNYGTYTVTIKPATNNKNVIGQTTAQFSIFSQDIKGAKFFTKTTEKDGTVKYTEYTPTDCEYTAEQIKPDVSKLVVAKKDTTGKVTEIDPADYTIEYGENVKAGTGHIYIVGKRTYEGSKETIDFNIKKAVVTKDDLKAAEYVIINKDAKEAKEYASAIGVVVKAKNGAKPAKEFTLTEGTDYTVSYAYDNTTDKNKVDNNIIATITLKADGNFETKENTLTTSTRIASPIISDTDIKLNQTSYEYTGAVIVPDFSVVVGGKTLKKDTDYVIDNIVDSAKVGTATVYITGKGEYDNKVKAKATFTVTPASAEKTVVTVSGDYTYDGKAQKPAASTVTVKLNGNDVTDQFDVSYGENINAGKTAGTVKVTPKKDNQNFTSGTSQTGTFEIKAAELEGTLTVYDERGIAYTISANGEIQKKNAEGKYETVAFDYDETEKTFAKVVFTPTGDLAKYVTTDDYEIKYINNVTGGGDGAYVVVVAKGNFIGKETLKEASADNKEVKVENVTAKAGFVINSKLYFAGKEVSVTDAEFAGTNMYTTPTIVVKDGAKTLKEGTDYTVTLYDKKDGTKITGANTIGTYYYVVSGIGVYKDAIDDIKDHSERKNHAEGEWKVTKKDVANLDVKVDLNEKGEAVLTVMNGNLKVDNKEFTVTLSEDKKTATVAATTGNKYYIGSKEVTVGGEVVKVGAPIISNVKVTGNKATVILSGEADGAVGYDYVISTDRDCITNKNYDSISKNQVQTSTSFKYVQQGTYYAYCHAWKRDENGKKVFGEWSNAYPFSVTAITPDAPVITNVKVSGSTIKVTYKAAANATGYDVVLGTSSKKENGETRPYNYGAHKKLNLKEGTVTATFKNVPKGTWTVGMHAFNRTSEDGSKVFSAWSNLKKATVK